MGSRVGSASAKVAFVVQAALIACGDERAADSASWGGSASLSGASDSDAGDDEGGSTSSNFDVGDGGAADSGAPPDLCKVADDMDAPGACDDQAPPNSFSPQVQWSFAGIDGMTQSVVTPLVANLTDDNGDQEIDLCDVPDVVVVGYRNVNDPSGDYWNDVGQIIVLDGATGAVHFTIPREVSAVVNPALGDIDGDGLVEIVTAEPIDPTSYSTGRLVAFEHDGTLAWTGDTAFSIGQNPVALADLDADGDVEIMLGGRVADHLGRTLWDIDPFSVSLTFGHSTTAADLDDDGDLEVVYGLEAFHHDGTPYYDVTDEIDAGHPQVVDIDADGQPEVVVSGYHGVSVIEHDGTLTLHHVLPEMCEWRPAAIHDIDDDGLPEILLGASGTYSALGHDISVRWSAVVDDGSGAAAGTAFDFLGDGGAEAMYADETSLFVLDEAGQVVMTGVRTSWTQVENPVVADVDNDGSAEIVVVSNLGYQPIAASPMVQVFRDAEERWVQARRIWNQHAYHVTNVREDGTIPRVMPKQWLGLNTFRTQAQIASGGSVCDPKPEG